MRFLVGRLVIVIIFLVGKVLNCFGGQDFMANELSRFMRDENIAGAVIVVSTGRRFFVYSMGDGASYKWGGEDMVAGMRFPIASLSKPITAAAIRSLIAKKQLTLDDKLTHLLPGLPFLVGANYELITVRHLLQHAAGFDRKRSGDPMFNSEGLAGCDVAVELAVRQPLDYLPGTDFQYSNVGYCLLGMVIERVSGEGYQLVVQKEVFDPARVNTFTMGPPLSNVRREGAFFSPNDWARAGAAGGWFSDALGLAKVLASDVLQSSIKSAPYVQKAGYYYGLGWRVWLDKDGYYLTHYGSLPGMFSIAVGYPDGRVAVALFNGRPKEDESAALQLSILLRQALADYCLSAPVSGALSKMQILSDQDYFFEQCTASILYVSPMRCSENNSAHYRWRCREVEE